MRKKNSSTWLIVLSISIITGLLAIQFYLLRNTFLLSEKNYHNEVTAAFLKVQSGKSYHEIMQDYFQTLAESAQKLENRQINEANFKIILQQKGDIISGRLDALLKAEARHNIKLKDVSEELGHITIGIDETNPLVIPIQKQDAAQINVEAGNKRYQVIPVGESTGSIDLAGDGKKPPITYAYKKNLQVAVFPYLIMRELVVVGVLSVVLLSGVVVLFYRVLNSSLKQQKINELRTDLVNNITHELKTPLSSMEIAFKTLKLLNPEMQSPEQDKLIVSLERQHSKLRRTVERVLESAAPNENSDLDVLDIVPLLSGYQNHSVTQSHPLLVLTEPQAYNVKGNAGIIEGVIDNLIENAQKYTTPGTEIRLIGKPEGSLYRIEVVDSGNGIDPAAQKHLFSKFFRVPENNLHSVKGLGLGLYLSRQAIQRIGGEIKLTASSTSGSIFTIYLLKS